MNNLFFELIRLSIGTKDKLSKHPSVDEWSELYVMASRQTLLGVCFVGVRKYIEACGINNEKITIPTNIYYQWLAAAVQIQKRNNLLDKRCVELQSMLMSCGYKSSILKGQAIASFYGSLNTLRQPGDIDVFVNCGRIKSIEIAHSLGQNDVDWDYKHLHLKVFKDTEVEIHYRPDVSSNLLRNHSLQNFWKKHNQYFFDKKVQLESGDIICPKGTMHIFLLIHHSYRHVISGGVGLRQMMDLYYALEKRDSSDDVKLRRWLDKYGLIKISEAYMWVLVNVFGASTETLPFAVNEKEGKFLLQEIMVGGNFGRSHNRYKTSRNRFKILLNVIKRNCHLIGRYGIDALFVPIYYIWHFFWKRLTINTMLIDD